MQSLLLFCSYLATKT